MLRTTLRRLGGPCLLLTALFVSACSTAPTAHAVGQVGGSVTIVGDLLPDGDGSGQIFLLRDPDDHRSDALRREPLQGGPRTYTFLLDVVPAGTYYLEACLRFAAGQGCAPYTNDPQGHPTAVEVHAARSTLVQIRF